MATAIFLALVLHRPLLLEGDAGVGKTEVARVLAAWTGGELIRLQCYEGIDVSQAVYEWDYARQLLSLRATEPARQVAADPALPGEDAAAGGPLRRAVSSRDEGLARTSGAAKLSGDASGGPPSGGPPSGSDRHRLDPVDEVYSERFLVRRPLLAAIDHTDGPPPVLLIDEVDRADDEFEAFLLEILSDYAVTVPELGTFRAKVPPIVVVTSNRTRDVHDALKRRCLYHWVEHPDFEREVAIVRSRASEVLPVLARQVAAMVASLRELHLYKPPGVAETIDWATSLAALGRTELDERSVTLTLGTVLKYQEDQARVQAAGIGDLVRAAVARGA